MESGRSLLEQFAPRARERDRRSVLKKFTSRERDGVVITDVVEVVPWIGRGLDSMIAGASTSCSNPARDDGNDG